jgi:15-cis-phytoene synthase
VNAAYAHCEAQARERARDRWLGTLFAPAAARPHLHALIAFELELQRVREAARDPRAGEIRLVWWREALAGGRDEAQGHPVAAAMLETLSQLKPPPHLIETAIAARQFDLYDDPFPTLRDLEAYLVDTRAGLLRIAALALGRDDAAEACRRAGVALGLVELLRGGGPANFAPADLIARHGLTLDDWREGRAAPARAELIALARARCAKAARPPRALAPAFAELATAPLWLAALARGGAAPAAWRRQWALWRWMRRA